MGGWIGGVVGGLIVWLIGWFMKKKGKPQSLTHTQHHHHQGDHQPPRRDQNAAGAAKIRLRDQGEGPPAVPRDSARHLHYRQGGGRGPPVPWPAPPPPAGRRPGWPSPGAWGVYGCVGGWVGVFVVVCLVVVGGGGEVGGGWGDWMFRSWGLFFFLGGGGGKKENEHVVASIYCSMSLAVAQQTAADTTTITNKH